MTDETLSQLSKLNVARMDRFTDSLEGTTEVSKSLDEMLKAAQAVASEGKLQSEAEDNSAVGMQIKTQKLQKKEEVKTQRVKNVEESVLVRKEDADGLADGFSQRQGNREYRINPRLLSQLAEDLGIGIHENSGLEEMINFIRRRLTVDGESPDVSIVDKAFEFLIEASTAQLATAQGPAKDRLELIKQRLENAKIRHFEAHAAEIQVTQKIIGAVDAVVEKTGEIVKETLTRYRDIVHNPPDIQALRKFYQAKGYKALRAEWEGLNSYLGGNFKRTELGPELSQLSNATKKMQAILGVFRLTKEHSKRIVKYIDYYVLNFNRHAA